MDPLYNDKLQNKQEVVVVDFKMSFGSMIIFMVKWVIAAIPAMIVVFIILLIFLSILRGMMGGTRY